MKLGSRYRKSERQSCLFLLMFVLNLKCGYFRSLDIECDWSVQRLSCPPYTTTDWDCLRKQLNCTNGGEYHCLRDESGEWTEACAKPITCSKGQEPILKNFQILCTNCKNPERYEPIDGTESYEYSECRRIKTSCPRDVSFECLVDDSVQTAQNRQCRCAHEKDYMPQNYDLNSGTWICMEPDDLNCIYAPCPEDVYGNAQTRNEKYRCERLLSPVTLTSSKRPTNRTSHQIVTQSVTRTSIETVPDTETTVYPYWNLRLTVGMFVLVSLCSIVFLIVTYMKRRYKIGTPVNLTASEIKYFELTLSWEPPHGYLPTHYKLEKREDSSQSWIKIDKISAEKAVYYVRGLKAGTLYSFRVTAKNNRKKSKPEGCQALTKPLTVPGAPLELIGGFDFEARRIYLRWKQPEDNGGTPVVDYLVQYSSDGEWTDCDSAKINTEWTSSNFTGGVLYNFRVLAGNEKGYSIPAEVKEKIKYRSIPSKPRDIAVTNIKTNTMNLSWKPPETDGGEKVTNYLIKLKEDELDWQQVQDVKSNTCSILVRNIKPSKSYRFGVKAVNGIGESNWKETESPVVAREIVRPDAPQEADTDLHIGHSYVILTWKPPKDDGGSELLGYCVEKKNRIFVNDSIADLEPNVTSVKITVTEDTTYTFLVYAKNIKGKSEPIEFTVKSKGKTDTELGSQQKMDSESVEGTSVDKGLSACPANINTDVKDSNVIVSWKPPTDSSARKIEQYVVSLKHDGNDWKDIDTVKSSKYQTQVKNLKPYTNYYFRVRALFKHGEQGGFIETCAPVILQEKKEKVLGVLKRTSLIQMPQAEDQSEKTDLSGEEESAEPGNLPGAGTNKLSSKTVYGRGLSSDKKEVSDAQGTENHIQSTGTLIETETPGPPEDFRVAPIGQKACTLRWKQPNTFGGSKCTGFVVKKRESDATAWITVEELTSDVLTYTIRDLPYRKSINFSVAAKNSFGIGQASETEQPLIVKYSLEDLQPVGPVEFSVLTDSSVRLTWRPPNVDISAITGYIIEYKDTKETFHSWTLGGSVTPENTSCVVKDKFEETHKYIFRIFSNSAEGNSQPLISKEMQISLLRKEKEGVNSKTTDGLKDEADSSATDVDAAETEDAAESQEKEKKALEMLEILKSIKDWDAFVRHAAGIKPLLKGSWIIPNKTVLHLTGIAEYKDSSKHLPDNLTAYECLDDGNSLFNSVSLILFGNTSHASRLRLVAVADGIAKLSFYKKQYFGERNKDDVIKLMKSFFSMTSSKEFALSGVENEDEIREKATRMAVRETAMEGSKCNPLQVQFLSSATGFNIKQHFEKQCQDFYGNVTHEPKVVRAKISREYAKESSTKKDSYFHILWVSAEPMRKTAKNRTINRAYPIMKKEERTTEV